jgi:iron(III) transport system substrate-binding protein
MDYFTSLKENDVVIVSGNSHARDLVLRGKVKICLTDTDDVISAKDRGGSIEMIFPDKEGFGTLLIPNTIALVKGGPHPTEAKKLIDFLLSPEVEQMLANSSSAQIPVREGLVSRSEIREIHYAKIMNVDFEKAYEYIGKSRSFLISDFLPK